MIGRKLTARLVADQNVGDRAIERLSLADVVPPQQPASAAAQVELVATDLAAPGEAERLVGGRPDLIFHLAAVVSGEAEADFDKGYRVNLDGTRALLEAVRAAHTADGYPPSLVFASSLLATARRTQSHSRGVSGDATHQLRHPEAMGELLLADYTRRGFVDGSDRLPPICIRRDHRTGPRRVLFEHPREPLVGQEAVLPVRRRSGTGTPRPAQRWSSGPAATLAVSRSARGGRCPCPASAPL